MDNSFIDKVAKLKKLISIGVLSLLLSSCATTPESMNSLSVGMKKSDVVTTMGPPQSVSSDGNVEYLNYTFCIERCMAPAYERIYAPFYVRIKSGSVDSFGRKGDFDSTKTPTSKLEISKQEDIKITNSGDMYTDLKKLKELLDSGVITQDEFDAKKKLILSK